MYFVKPTLYMLYSGTVGWCSNSATLIGPQLHPVFSRLGNSSRRALVSWLSLLPAISGDTNWACGVRGGRTPEHCADGMEYQSIITVTALRLLVEERLGRPQSYPRRLRRCRPLSIVIHRYHASYLSILRCTRNLKVLGWMCN